MSVNISSHGGESKKKEVIRIFLSIFIFFLLFNISMYVFEDDLDEPYEWGNRYEIPYKINECRKLFNSNQDKFKILFLGDSRVRSAAFPIYIDNFFQNKTITYNLGVSGTAIRDQSIILKAILDNKIHPDLIIWDMSPSDFGAFPDTIRYYYNILESNMGRYHMNYKENLSFNELVRYYMFKYIPLYRHKSNIVPRDFGIYYYKFHFINGYVPLEYNGFTINLTEPYVLNYQMKFDNEAEIAFNNSIQMLKQANVNFMIVVFPKNYEIRKEVHFESILNKIDDDRKLDLRGKPELLNETLYYNFGHLCHEGALVYSRLVSEKINSIYYIVE